MTACQAFKLNLNISQENHWKTIPGAWPFHKHVLTEEHLIFQYKERKVARKKMLEDVLLKPQTMKVRQVQGIENVATAVWFATLLLTYDHCNQMVNFVETDTYLKQVTIRNIAEQIINRIHRVDQSRVGEYCNGDCPDGSTLNYLRANGKARRLTAMGEFNWHKEKPMEIGRYDASIFEVLDDNDNPVYQISGADLRSWYENIYSPLISPNHNL